MFRTLLTRDWDWRLCSRLRERDEKIAASLTVSTAVCSAGYYTVWNGGILFFNGSLFFSFRRLLHGYALSPPKHTVRYPNTALVCVTHRQRLTEENYRAHSTVTCIIIES